MKTTLSEALLSELNRHNQINKYIFEQDVPLDEPAPAGDVPPPAGADVPPPPGDATLGGATPPPTEPGAEPGQPIDVANDPDVEEITDDEIQKINISTGTGDSSSECLWQKGRIC
ncbi:hypothetical protein [Undibacterium luofuense]|uniref:hypothetical protein n=1 Tax=Undibacterium luofuense TaxID=2828733 RepID=UPI0030ED97E7